MNCVIVVPTIREDSISRFLEEWKFNAEIVVVEDNPTKTFNLKGVEHYSWKEIDEDLGNDRWIIPRRTDAIRNYGFIVASRKKPDMILTLDDDCYPWRTSTDSADLIRDHWKVLETPGVDIPVFDTMFALQTHVKPRGFPKVHYPVQTVLNHGLWNNVPDLDGETQMEVGEMSVTFQKHSIQVLRETYFPMCGMNVSFRPEILPAMYFFPMGQGQPYHRFADIWCGLVMKLVADYMGYSVRSGYPFVNHSRASNAQKNAMLEKDGLPVNETLWQVAQAIFIEDADTTAEAFLEVMDNLEQHMKGEYWHNLRKASHLWVNHISQ